MAKKITKAHAQEISVLFSEWVRTQHSMTYHRKSQSGHSQVVMAELKEACNTIEDKLRNEFGIVISSSKE